MFNSQIKKSISNTRHASKLLACMSSREKNELLLAIIKAIESNKQLIGEANDKDLQNASLRKLPDSMYDRLRFTQTNFQNMCNGVHQIVSLADPVGEIECIKRQPSGIEVGLMRQPIGVIGMIYESRPNVTIDAVALCLKAGNAVVLRGGSEAFETNRALKHCVDIGLEKSKVSLATVVMPENTDRKFISYMIREDGFCDIVIPRGGKELIKRVFKEAKIPVLKHLDGNCHVYIDEKCILSEALAVVENSKTNRYGVCNAAESILVHEAIAEEILPLLSDVLRRHNVEIRGCDSVVHLIPDATKASESDWFTEYLAPIVSVKIVSSIQQAIEHINFYGSSHTDAILSTEYTSIRKFIREVDSSSVVVNASTRFADGFEYGLGAEIGISTDKIHARGPVGLKGLTNQKWVVHGSGQIRL